MKALVARFALTAALIGTARLALAADSYPAQQIAPQQRCPVCGMYPAKFPGWATQVIYKDHTMIAPESPAELFRFLRDVRRYDPRHSGDKIGRIWVTDYEKRTWIDAKSAYFVAGSKLRGPMGPDLPAFDSKARAEAFARRADGRVLTFAEVTPQVLSGAAAHTHHGGTRR